VSDWPNPCIVCDRELENAIGDSVGQPYAGTAFLSGGHYGSTVWDPCSEYRNLRVIVCDTCLIEAAKAGRVLYEVVAPRAPVVDQRLWNGQEGRE